MARRRSITSLQLLATFAASIFMFAAEAIQLGDIRTHSALGQPLDATVGVWMTASDKAQPLRLKVSPDLAYRANSDIAAMVSGMSAELVTTANGTNYIQLRSNSVINEPVLAFRVKVYVGENAVMRNYSLALNPAPPVRATTTKRRARSVTPITDANYTVNDGDTLWAIARRVGRTTGTGTNDLVAQIFADNPHAFVNGNQDRLIRGAELRLPIGSSAAPAATPATVTDTSTAVLPQATTQADPVVNIPAAATSSTAVATATLATQSKQASVKPQQAVDWRLRDPQLAAELERLRLKYRALKQQYDTQQQSVQTDPAAGAPTEITVVDEVADAEVANEVPATAEATAPADSVATNESNSPDLTPEKDAGATAVEMPADTRSASGLSIMAIVALVCAGLALLALFAIALRKLRVAMKKRQSELAHHAREADFKAEVARKAANRVQMESEVQRMLANRDAATVVTAPASAPSAAGESAKPGAGTDAEIDQNIAHGRYNEAESQLIAVIAANPKNYSAKLRLLEVYYMIEEVDSFCDVADDLHVNHRADLSDDEWRRVIRMGKVTAPDRMPFSGPRALDSSNQAS